MDIEPGDRSERCGGLMKPLRLEGSTPSYRIVHRCLQCQVERRNNVAAGDDAMAIVALAKSHT